MNKPERLIGRKHELSEMLQEAEYYCSDTRLLDLARLLADNDVATLQELKERLNQIGNGV